MCGMSCDVLISRGFNVSNYAAANMALLHAVRLYMSLEHISACVQCDWKRVFALDWLLRCAQNGQNPTVRALSPVQGVCIA